MNIESSKAKYDSVWAEFSGMWLRMSFACEAIVVVPAKLMMGVNDTNTLGGT